MCKMKCQLRKDLLVRTPQIFLFRLKQLSEFFYKFKIAGSKFQKSNGNVQNPFNFKK